MSSKRSPSAHRKKVSVQLSANPWRKTCSARPSKRPSSIPTALKSAPKARRSRKMPSTASSTATSMKSRSATTTSAASKSRLSSKTAATASSNRWKTASKAVRLLKPWSIRKRVKSSWPSTKKSWLTRPKKSQNIMIKSGSAASSPAAAVMASARSAMAATLVRAAR